MKRFKLLSLTLFIISMSSCEAYIKTVELRSTIFVYSFVITFVIGLIAFIFREKDN